MSTQPHSQIEIIEDCICRVDRTLGIVRKMLADAPANQAIGLLEETNLQRKQLGLKPLS